jgi:hypothetical protein
VDQAAVVPPGVAAEAEEGGESPALGIGTYILQVLIEVFDSVLLGTV